MCLSGRPGYVVGRERSSLLWLVLHRRCRRLHLRERTVLLQGKEIHWVRIPRITFHQLDEEKWLIQQWPPYSMLRVLVCSSYAGLHDQFHGRVEPVRLEDRLRDRTGPDVGKRIKRVRVQRRGGVQWWPGIPREGLRSLLTSHIHRDNPLRQGIASRVGCLVVQRERVSFRWLNFLMSPILEEPR